MLDTNKEIRLAISSLCGYGKSLDEKRAVNGVIKLLQAERKRTLEEVYKHIGNIIDDCEQENYQVAFRHLLMKLEDKLSKLKYKDNGN